MRLTILACVMAIAVLPASRACSVTLTFDDIPQGMGLEFYSIQYGIGFDRAFRTADHTGSGWGPPHSAKNVLVWDGFGGNAAGMMLKSDDGPLDAYSISGYFSTEPGIVIEMIGYHRTQDSPVASVLIGADGHSWNNVHAQISSAAGIDIVVFWPVAPATTDALLHFCADDVTVEFVREPTSLLAVTPGLAALALRRRRR